MIRLLAVAIVAAIFSAFLELSYQETFLSVGVGVLLMDSWNKRG